MRTGQPRRDAVRSVPSVLSGGEPTGRKRPQMVAVALGTLAATMVAIVAMASSGGESGESGRPGQADLQAGSAAAEVADRPPAAVLLAGGSSGASGLIVYQAWMRDGEREIVDRGDPPVRWPEPVGVEPGDPIVVELRTGTRPESVTVKVWERIERNGVPAGDPRAFECHPDAAPDGCLLIPAGGAWRVRIPSSVAGARAFIALSGVWTTRGEGGQSSTASWLFAIS